MAKVFVTVSEEGQVREILRGSTEEMRAQLARALKGKNFKDVVVPAGYVQDGKAELFTLFENYDGTYFTFGEDPIGALGVMAESAGIPFVYYNESGIAILDGKGVRLEYKAETPEKTAEGLIEKCIREAEDPDYREHYIHEMFVREKEGCMPRPIPEYLNMAEISLEHLRRFVRITRLAKTTEVTVSNIRTGESVFQDDVPVNGDAVLYGRKYQFHSFGTAAYVTGNDLCVSRGVVAGRLIMEIAGDKVQDVKEAFYKENGLVPVVIEATLSKSVKRTVAVPRDEYEKFLQDDYSDVLANLFNAAKETDASYSYKVFSPEGRLLVDSEEER